MNLVLDLGNSRAKAALFNGANLIEQKEFANNDRNALVQYIHSQESVDRGIISNVGEELELNKTNFPLLRLCHKTPIPFKMAYATPETLGLDRIALMASAQKFYSTKNCLVIDAGTCITYDFMNDAGVYNGGGISPGIEMRLKALPHFTSRLPKVEITGDFQLIGDSTQNSILSGTIGGYRREVEATIEEYKKRYPSLIIIITGGNANLFDYLLKNSIFASPNFLVMGLNHILEYNAERL